MRSTPSKYSSVTSSARHWEIWPASPLCLASADNAGPVVSITSTSDRCSLVGQRHAALDFSQRCGPNEPVGLPLLTENHRGLAAKSNQCQQCGRCLPVTGVGQQHSGCSATTLVRHLAGQVVATPSQNPKPAHSVSVWVAAVLVLASETSAIIVSARSNVVRSPSSVTKCRLSRVAADSPLSGCRSRGFAV